MPFGRALYLAVFYVLNIASGVLQCCYKMPVLTGFGNFFAWIAYIFSYDLVGLVDLVEFLSPSQIGSK